jgi:hypothetical protein
MATGQDASQSGASRIYVKQQPQGTTINGNAVITEQVIDTGGLDNTFGLQALNGQILPAKITFTIAPGAANHSVITIQVVDNGGQAVTGFPFDLDIIFSDNADGTGLTATALTAQSFTSGVLLNTYTASKAFYVQTDNLGKVVVDITQAAKTAYVVMVQAGCQPLPAVSRALVAGDYG